MNPKQRLLFLLLPLLFVKSITFAGYIYAMTGDPVRHHIIVGVDYGTTYSGESVPAFYCVGECSDFVFNIL